LEAVKKMATKDFLVDWPSSPGDKSRGAIWKDIDLNQLPVLVNAGRLRGTVSRGQVLQLFQIRAELKA
jgi:hypothetical protein